MAQTCRGRAHIHGKPCLADYVILCAQDTASLWQLSVLELEALASFQTKHVLTCLLKAIEKTQPAVANVDYVANHDKSKPSLMQACKI